MKSRHPIALQTMRREAVDRRVAGSRFAGHVAAAIATAAAIALGPGRAGAQTTPAPAKPDETAAAPAPPAAQNPEQQAPAPAPATPAPQPGAPPSDAPVLPPAPPPAAETPKPPPPPAAKPAEATPPPAADAGVKDELAGASYLPGYRRHLGLGIAPYAPQVGAFPGGMTPGSAGPRPDKDFSFKWSGFMSASLQFSANTRKRVGEDQSRNVLHAQQMTIDEWYAFVSTNTVPGNWVSMNFQYGNDRVGAYVSMSTWNLTDPSTYYQIGSQQFVSYSFLQFTPEEIAGFRLRWTVGYFNAPYGNLGQYGNGMYVNSPMGFIRGTGETLVVERNLSDSLVAMVEHGIMGPRIGKVPDAAVNSPGADNPLWLASWIHHAHLGIVHKGEPELRLTLHYIGNWSQDDQVRYQTDNPGTFAIDETNIKDGRIDAFGFDAHLISNPWGMLGIGGAFIQGRNAYTLKGYTTWGGDGEALTDKWFGPRSGGNGSLYVGAINYTASLGKIVSYPTPFGGDGPDIMVTAGMHIASATTNYEPLDGRLRYKFAGDVLYTPFKYFGMGLRADRVAPNSEDSQETFYVIAPRLQFRSDWNSREMVTVRYAKWFYGTHTHSDLLGARQIDRLDDQLFALNFNMWW